MVKSRITSYNVCYTKLCEAWFGEAFDAAIAAMSKAIRKGDRVQIPGFGSFSVSKRAARKGRNPATGATITIKASKNVRFKAGKELKDSLNKR